MCTCMPQTLHTKTLQQVYDILLSKRVATFLRTTNFSHTNGSLYLVQVHVHSNMKFLNIQPFHLSACIYVCLYVCTFEVSLYNTHISYFSSCEAQWKVLQYW